MLNTNLSYCKDSVADRSMTRCRQCLERSINEAGRPFGYTSEKKICGFITNNTSRIMNKSSIDKDIRVLQPTFPAALKPTNHRYRYKSRLVALNYDHNQSIIFGTKVPTVQRLTTRLIHLQAALTCIVRHNTRDTTQACIQ